MLPNNGNKKYCIDCSYYISQAPFFHKYILDTYDISLDNIVCLGVPRNDQLYYSLGVLRNGGSPLCECLAGMEDIEHWPTIWLLLFNWMRWL